MRLIDADAYECVEWSDIPEGYADDFAGGVLWMLDRIDEQPIIEPRRGKWEPWEGYNYEDVYKCSACGADWVCIEGTPADNDMNYCPHCGAKMEVYEDV